MSNTPDPFSFVSESRIRFALRLGSTDENTALTASLRELLAEAISWAERETGLPILPLSGYVETYPESPKGPVIFCLPHAKRLLGVKFWQEAEMRQEPDGDITTGELGRALNL